MNTNIDENLRDSALKEVDKVDIVQKVMGVIESAQKGNTGHYGSC